MTTDREEAWREALRAPKLQRPRRITVDADVRVEISDDAGPFLRGTRVRLDDMEIVAISSWDEISGVMTACVFGRFRRGNWDQLAPERLPGELCSPFGWIKHHPQLVDLFIAAKSKRQVIMVTHNANLVINTDADQVIVAEVGHHEQGNLPEITYRSGGLENAEIRKSVCDILEGGERAFKERARRLRVRLGR